VTGSIVAVEVIPDEECDLENLSGAIRACCTDLVAAARPRSIRFVDSIATAGHKIVRRSVDGE
jgi:predicted DNA-binding ribbon-helix-helix protein